MSITTYMLSNVITEGFNFYFRNEYERISGFACYVSLILLCLSQTYKNKYFFIPIAHYISLDRHSSVREPIGVSLGSQLLSGTGRLNKVTASIRGRSNSF